MGPVANLKDMKNRLCQLYGYNEGTYTNGLTYAIFHLKNIDSTFYNFGQVIWFSAKVGSNGQESALYWVQTVHGSFS